MIRLEKNDIILFNGDSITDCGRDRDNFHSLSGYNLMIKNYFDTFFSGMNIDCFNRGIGGEVSKEMLVRLEKELIETKATVLSFLIGVNDAWRSYETPAPTNDEDFCAHIENIFILAQKHVKKIIVLEPFLLDSYANFDNFYKEVMSKAVVLRRLATKYKAEFIPLDGIFAEASVFTAASNLSADGIHPTITGNSLIAREWLKRVSL